MWTDGQTDITKLIVAFQNFANATKNQIKWPKLHQPYLVPRGIGVIYDVYEPKLNFMYIV